MMGAQMMEQCRRQGVQRFMAIGIVCSYSKFTPARTSFKVGLERTVQWYLEHGGKCLIV